MDEVEEDVEVKLMVALKLVEDVTNVVPDVDVKIVFTVVGWLKGGLLLIDVVVVAETVELGVNVEIDDVREFVDPVVVNEDEIEVVSVVEINKVVKVDVG